MEIINKGLFKFDSFLPIYNWYYPLSGYQFKTNRDYKEVFDSSRYKSKKSIALYFHIPFCNTACSFCPFSKTLNWDENVLDLYVEALVNEIYHKVKCTSISNAPIKAIFFGGGTPSILSSEQVIKIGKAINESFQLSDNYEFSVEVTAISLNDDKIDAWKKIGATHVRFGVQTFIPRYRKMFNLKTSMQNIIDFSSKLSQLFQNVSFDMLYGMNGQTEDEFVSDVCNAVKLGINNIDYYPINNLVTSDSLHALYKNEGLGTTSSQKKLLFNILLREIMQANNFRPHNGHGYVKVDDHDDFNNVITNKYTFWYHNFIYGYENDEYVGFGSSAISSIKNHTIRNYESWEKYTHSVLFSGEPYFDVFRHDESLDHSKGIILHLPYHGSLNKSLIDTSKICDDTKNALDKALKHGLVIENGDELKLSKTGWYWYVNLLYYFSPMVEKQLIDKFIKDQIVGNCRIPDNTDVQIYEPAF